MLSFLYVIGLIAQCSSVSKKVVKKRYMPIAAVVAIRLKEDEKEYEERILPDDPATEQPAKYRSAYLIISNRIDAPEKALSVYVKRWLIGVSS